MMGKWMMEKPEAVKMAQEKRKGMNWFLEILVFLAVFIAVGIAQLLVMIPGQLLLNSADGDLVMVVILFSNIGMILVVLGFCKLIQKRNPVTLGFTRRGALKEYLIGFAAGFLVFSATALICVVTGAMKIEGFSETFTVGMFVLFLLGFMIQGMAEEVLCRGYFMVSLGRRNSMWTAILLNALAFAALHLLNNGISVLAFVNLTLYGIFISIYFVKRGSIWGAGGFHSMWNLAQGNIYGVLVSGMGSDCTLMKSSSTQGMEIVNGGAFGIEGGLAMTIVCLAGILFLVLCCSNKKES